MNSNKKVACPMDCYDACQAEVVDNNIKGSKDNIVTSGKLCVNFAQLLKEDNLKNPIFDNKEISLDESLEILSEKLKEADSSNTLFYTGSGNLGVLQNSTKNFFTQYGSVLTKGSLCDGGGGLGIEQGRTAVVNPPIEKLIDSDIIIVWGRNFSVTSSHMYNLVKDKTFITIDPIKTDIAKKSKIHMQINPKTDYELALLLTRFTHMQDMEDEEFLEEYTEGSEWFFDITRNRPVVSYEATTGIPLSQVNELLELVENKKVSIVVGLGVQKYFEGAQILRCIDSFAAYLGVHKKDSGGVWYLSDSGYGYENQVKIAGKNKKVSVAEVDFSSYDLVFIQGGNPVVSAPNTKSVIEGLKNSFVVCFTTTYNDTCEYADLVIPSSSFLSKRDVRLSYGHEYKAFSEIVEPALENTISEYKLATYLIEKFGFKSLKSENEIIDYYKNTNVVHEEFETFEFIEELDIEPLYKNKTSSNFYLITGKSKNSLNSQFTIDNHVYLHPSSGFKNEDNVKITSPYGEAVFTVMISEDIKEQCAFFYTGNKKTNYLTPNKADEESFSAMFQEVLLEIELS
ncbi:molybdopterin-dependent oxidoreductase [Poseidonibacter ostreae]|uniref:Molybdopterin-dependent oxidoreductase n=1 Tax=Poseidonibacter ostreae TaxID=2654171 RepID=A0A6L4WVA2_9BACT|nr:molybdopterin-dependent oxidoreductase [Poseidonibacter ostreae]KAB7885379.1 molybdopterin-dependent oxidoreductase [Poseidonibacter ostreae]KAB7890359.1 molybdopterin-dependent oxidoreductase [Poseidonibacter ostreae]KAB7890589.1 molybdopterin-dependent oxidoreductase [Poseidonibacter ostreae]